MDDLYARFLPQFVALARTRLAQAISTAGTRDDGAVTTTVRELVPLARDCEQKAKQLLISRADADVDVLIAALRQLVGRIEEVSQA